MVLGNDIVILVILGLHGARGSCFFPVELQGEFMTQWLESKEITYTSISITYNSIPGWGECVARHSDNFILSDTERWEGSCYKCVKIVQRSVNVIQTHSTGYHACHPTVAAARASCPGQHSRASCPGQHNRSTLTAATDFRSRQQTGVKGRAGQLGHGVKGGASHQQSPAGQEMMLYKTRGFYGEPAVSPLVCPLTGRWLFTYHRGGQEGEVSCPDPVSEASTCPNSYKIDLNFRGCQFPDFNMSFQCLATWTGAAGQLYLALLDTKLPQLGEKLRPRYRCAIYTEPDHSGLTHMTLSNDSTCVNQLVSASQGFETLALKLLPEEGQKEEEEVTGRLFPEWSQGSWGEEGALVVRGDRIVYRSNSDLTTYTISCLSAISPTLYKVSLRSPCSRLGYTCLQLEQRTANILEFRLGTTQPVKSDSLCQQSGLPEAAWVTQGRESEPVACPLHGRLKGVIPDAENLCARSSTSCARPDLMEYQVYNCENTTEVYEDRMYQCYGQFEADGLVYTYTRRLDLPIQECFVGTTLNTGQLYITEAGQNCARGKDPVADGMLMHIVEKPFVCDNNSAANSLAGEVVDNLDRVDLAGGSGGFGRGSSGEMQEEYSLSPGVTNSHSGEERNGVAGSNCASTPHVMLLLSLISFHYLRKD